MVALAKPIAEGATMSAPVASPVAVNAQRRQNVLRVLSGAHLGAEVPISAERLLVGNLDTECDLVLDVGLSQRHVCLLRISSDGWTVLSIAGDVWIDTEHLAPQQTRALLPGQPVTLGRIAFAVGDAASTAWDMVRPPTELLKPDAGGAVPVAPAIGPRPRVLQGWKATRLAAGVGLGALILAASLSYIANVMQTTAPPESEAARRLDRARALLEALPIAREVNAAQDPDQRGHIRLAGYVAQSENATQIEAVLRDASLPVTRRLHAVSAMEAELSRRIVGGDASTLRYDERGVFSLESEAASLLALDASLRTALHEMPEVNGFRVIVTDMHEASGRNVMVNYRRSAERISDIVVDEADLVRRTRTRFVVREVRLGVLPSVLLFDGRTYFSGSQLPDGWLVNSISADQVLLRLGDKERTLKISDASNARK